MLGSYSLEFFPIAEVHLMCMFSTSGAIAAKAVLQYDTNV